MPVTVRRIDSVDVIEIEGEITYDLTMKLAEALDRLIDSDSRSMLIVPRDIEFINSLTVGTLFTRLNRLRGHAGVMAMAEVTPGLMKILRMTGFDRLVEFHDDVPSAVEALDAASRPGD